MEKIDRLPWGATELRKPRFSPKQFFFLNRAEKKTYMLAHQWDKMQATKS